MSTKSLKLIGTIAMVSVISTIAMRFIEKRSAVVQKITNL
jgi:hypothetical protein